MLDEKLAKELRKTKKQREGEEDPVLVAQRFLNIYRQLHIFDESKKVSFNQMLMELRPEIKALFSTLPGGIVLQDYIEELEGNPKDEQIVSDDASSERNPSDTTILATALAETQKQDSPAVQPQIVQPVVQTIPQSATISSKVELGASFAQELASALKDNATTQQKELQAVIQTLEKTQMEMIKTLQTESNGRKEETQALLQLFLDAQKKLTESVQNRPVTVETTAQGQTFQSTDNSELLNQLAASQVQLSETLNKRFGAEKSSSGENVEQLAQLLKLIAASQQQMSKMLYALGDGNKNNQQQTALLFETAQKQFNTALDQFSQERKQSHTELAQMFSASQKELAQILLQNNNSSTATNQTANNIQVNTVDYSAQLNLIAERLANLHPAVSAPTLHQAPIVLEEHSSTPTPENGQRYEQLLENGVEQILKAQSDLYRETVLLQTKELGATISQALKESQQLSTEQFLTALERILKTTTFIPTESLSNQTFMEQPLENYQAPIAFNNEEMSLPEQPVVMETYVDTSSEPENVAAEEAVVPDIAPFEEEPSSTKKKKKKKRKKKDNHENVEPQTMPEADDFGLGLEDTPLSSLTETPVFDDVWSDVPPAEEVFEKEEIFAEEEPEDFQMAPSPTEDFFVEEDNASDSGEDFDDPALWGFKTEDEPSEKQVSAPSDTNDWEWEYVEEEEEKEGEGDGDTQDWEWEYVEDESTSSNETLKPINNNSAIYSGDLYFHKSTRTNTSLPQTDSLPEIEPRNIAIKDSLTSEKKEDPYQNSHPKH